MLGTVELGTILPLTPTLPHQGGGGLVSPSPLVGEGALFLPPPWWGRGPCFSLPPGGGGGLVSPSPLVGEGWGGGEEKNVTSPRAQYKERKKPAMSANVYFSWYFTSPPAWVFGGTVVR